MTSWLLSQIPYEVVGRREGDAETVYADPALAAKELGWTAKLGLQDMCKFVQAFFSTMARFCK